MFISLNPIFSTSLAKKKKKDGMYSLFSNEPYEENEKNRILRTKFQKPHKGRPYSLLVNRKGKSKQHGVQISPFSFLLSSGGRDTNCRIL